MAQISPANGFRIQPLPASELRVKDSAKDRKIELAELFSHALLSLYRTIVTTAHVLRVTDVKQDSLGKDIVV